MFSLISPTYEINLKAELASCQKYMNIPFEELRRMPVRDRRFFISWHNKKCEEEKNGLDGKEMMYAENFNKTVNNQ